jgi:membrane protein required for colicin V production
LNYIDFILFGGLAVGFILGFKDGIIRKLIGLLGVVAGLFAAFWWAETLGSKLIGFFDNERNLANIIAGILIFFVVLALFSIIKRIVHPADKINKFVNQLLGGIFGVFNCFLVIAIILVILELSPLKNTVVNLTENSHIVKSTRILIGELEKNYPKIEQEKEKIQGILDKKKQP